MMMEVEIYRVSQDDVIALRDISVRTFFETFSNQNRSSDMQKYLEESLSLEKLSTELANSNSEFYFAAINKVVIGYLKVNYNEAQSELKDSTSMELERIYVLQEYHGSGVGQSLYEKAISLAIERKVDSVWLGVWERNPRAIRFYEKNGFKEFDTHIFRLGDDDQTDIMMRLSMRN